MSIGRVQRGEVLTAAKLNELIDNANTQQGGRVEQEQIAAAEVSMKNVGQAKIYAGNPIVVTGSRVIGTLATRLDRFRKFGFQLQGRTNTITKTSSLAVAVEDISPGEIGRAVIPGLFAAYVYYKNDTDMQTKYCDVDNSGNFVYNQNEGEGAYEIVAPNGYEILEAGGSYYARNFAYIRSRGGGGSTASFPSAKAIKTVTTTDGNFIVSFSWANNAAPITNIPTLSSSISWLTPGVDDKIVTDVSINSDGDIVMTKQSFSLSITPGTPNTATLNTQTAKAIKTVTTTDDYFLQPASNS